MTDENGTYAMQEFALVEMSSHDDILLGSQALVLSENESDSSSNAKSGDLIIPGESENKEEKKKLQENGTYRLLSVPKKRKALHCHISSGFQ